MSGPRDLRKLGGSEELGRVQDYIEAALGPLIDSPIIDGVLLKSIELVTGLNSVDHKLGRMPLGWIIVSKNANEDVWESDRTKTKLSLNASGNITADFWIF